MSNLAFELGSQLMAQANRPNLNNYVPHPKQSQFHGSTCKAKLFLGGNRSGKTTGGTVEALYWLRGYHPNRPVPEPPIRARAIGVDFKDGVERILKPEFQRWIPPSLLKNGSWFDSFNSYTNTLTLTNGSFLEFMSYEQDIEKFAGTSRHFVYFDEEPPKAIWNENKMRLIDTHGSFWITMTPVLGMTWIYDDLYIPGITGLDRDILVVQVEITDNPHIHNDAIEIAFKGMDANEVEARKKGKFLQMSGVIFPNFDERHIKTLPPMDYLKQFPWYASMDHGLNSPTAWLWHAVEPDGTVYTFHEHYQREWTIDRHAAYIHQRNKEWGREPVSYVGDPSIRNRNPQTGLSVQVVYAMQDIPIALGNNDYPSSFNKMNMYLNAKPPKWYVTNNCINLIKEIRRYRWANYKSAKIRDERNPQEKPHKKDDHAVDAARYFFSFMPDLTYDIPKPEDHRPAVESYIFPTRPEYGDKTTESDFYAVREYDSDFSPVDEYLGNMY
jgi:phage terminase large subunit-like protein